jgi:hypothetical protein
MMNDTTSLENLLRQLPIQGEIVPTTGIGFGVIVRFKTFYLKVYDEKRGSAYRVSGYLYDGNAKVWEYSIPYNQFDRLASQLTEDNYLRRPLRVTWISDGIPSDEADWHDEGV